MLPYQDHPSPKYLSGQISSCVVLLLFRPTRRASQRMRRYRSCNPSKTSVSDLANQMFRVYVFTNLSEPTIRAKPSKIGFYVQSHTFQRPMLCTAALSRSFSSFHCQAAEGEIIVRRLVAFIPAFKDHCTRFYNHSSHSHPSKRQVAENTSIFSHSTTPATQLVPMRLLTLPMP